MTPPISVTILTHNEELKLWDCLRSVAWADEIVVLDSGSTDGTREMALDAGARFIAEGWKGYAAQKNLAAEYASHDWILNIDADERVGESLQEAICGCDFVAAAYSIHRVSDFLGMPHRPVHRPLRETLVRLYDRRRARFEGEAVHEKVETAGPVADLGGSLFHEGFRGLEDFASRLNNYSTLLASEKAEHSPVRLILRPPMRLLWCLFVQRLILDGRRGLILAWMWANHDLLVEAKRFEASLKPTKPFPNMHRSRGQSDLDPEA